MSAWERHGQDLIQRRGRWTLHVRRQRDGWDWAIKIRDVKVALAPRVWASKDEACAACAVYARDLALEGVGGEG